MAERLPDPWLRGPVPGIRTLLQPVAHALHAADEEVVSVVGALDHGAIWTKVGSVSSIGFHVIHLAGSTDRLFSYAAGQVLTESQRTALEQERNADDMRPSREDLLHTWAGAYADAMDRLRTTFSNADLEAVRTVGRAKLPSTVLGLLFHAAEHAARHSGQITTTAKILRSD